MRQMISAEVDGDDRYNYADIVWQMYVDTYSEVGLNMVSVADLLFEYSTWRLIFGSDNLRACVLFKETKFGKKSGAGIHDGTRAGKSAIIESIRKILFVPGYYAEVSHAVERIAVELNAPAVCVYDVPLVVNKPIEEVDSLHYRREITNVGWVTKVLVGRPYGVNTTDSQNPTCEIYRRNPPSVEYKEDDAADLDAHFSNLLF